jgi:capsular polysaccharide transport system permease protein
MTVTENKTQQREPLVGLAPPPATTALVPRMIGSLRRIVLERRPSTVPDVVDGDLLHEPQARTKAAIPPILLSFILLVVVPAAAISFYFAFLASDQFTAEARFAVRTAEPSGTASIGEGSSSSSVGLPALDSQDAEVIASYIRSRTIIDDLSKMIDIRAIFSRPEADFWARLPSNASKEDLDLYWLKMVGTYIENSSGIVTLKVRAFRRDDALKLAQLILQVSETLANSLSTRARADTMRRAEIEVQRADVQMREALAELGRYRDKEGFIDPVKTATDTSKLLTQVLGEKIRLETLLYTGKQTNPNSPTLSPLEAQVAGVDQQIAKLRAQIAGGDAQNRNLAASLVRFEEIEVKRQFAESIYTFARNGLDRARQAAERQSIYMSVFVPPALPQDYSYPSRITFSILSSVTLLIMWSIGAMIWASVLDHRL